MAVDSSIITRISGDASGLVAALEQSKEAVARFGDTAGKVLEQKLGLKDVFKGLLQGAGIASIGAVVEKLVGPFKEAAESAEKLEDLTGKTADATERLIKLRQTDNQQLDTAVKQMERLQKQAEALAKSAPSKTYLGFIGRGSAADIMFGFSRREDAKRQEAIHQTTLAAKNKEVEVEEKKIEIRKKDEALAMRIAKEDFSNSEKLTEAKQKLYELERDAKFKTLDADGKLLILAKDKLKVDADINKYARFIAQGGELTLDGTNDLIGLKERQRDLEKEIADVTAEKAKAETQIGNQIVSNIAQWENFVAVVTSTGRGNAELSDAELERKIANTKADIFRRTGNDFGFVDAAGNPLGDAFLGPQKNNLQQALAEKAFRDKVRRDTAFFGEEAAFRMNPGVTQQRFAQINNTETKLDKIEQALLKLDERLKGGIPTLTVGAIRG